MSSVWAQCTLPAPIIRISQVNSTMAAIGTFCRGEQVQLNAVTNQANVRYQWKRDGSNITGATTATLVVNQNGLYTVSIETAACPNAVASTPIVITTQDCSPTGRVRIRGGVIEEDINDNLLNFKTASIRLTLYGYATEQTQYPASIPAYIYRKRDNTLVRTVTMQRRSQIENVWAGVPACGNDSTQLQDIYYFYNMSYEPGVFNDPGGYYITTASVCCREVSDNLPGGDSMVHYMEFAAHTKYNLNEPRTVFVPEMYIPFWMEACAGKPFTTRNYIDPSSANIKFAQYSFAPPLTNLNAPPRHQPSAMAPGYSLANFTGNTTTNGLTIDPNTGSISGTPERPGRYAYVVRAEVFQGTEIVGEIRQEININVKDCDNPKPTLFATAPGGATPVDARICPGQSLQLNARDVSATGKLQWQRDGVAISGATASSLVVNQAGEYTLSVIKTGACPPLVLSDELSVSVTSPTVSASVAVPPSCTNQPIVLLASTTAVGATFDWLRDGSEVLLGSSATYSTTATGNYQVRLTDALGCTALSPVLPVSNTQAAPTVQLRQEQRTGATLCRGQGRYLRAETAATAAKFDWYLNGTQLTGVTSATYDPEQGGTYIVRTTTPAGCTAQSGVIALANPAPAPVLSLLSSGSTVCPGQTTILTTVPNAAFRYQWTRDGTPIATATEFLYQASAPGQYAVRVSDAVSCTVLAGPLSVSARTGPVVQLSGSASICQATTTPLLASGTEAIKQYEWLLNGSPTPGNAATLVTGQAGTYRVRVTDLDGCTAVSSDWQLSIVDRITVQMAALNSVCANASPLTLSATPGGGVFSGPGVNGSLFNPAQAGAGQHTITYTLAGPTTCQSGTASQPATVRALPALPAVNLVTLNVGSSVELTGPVGNSYQYTWEPPTGLSSPTIRNPVATPDQSTSYRLRVRDGAGCEATGEFVVEVVRQLFFPNAFTPNGDGQNDTWELFGVQGFPDLEVTVFNRWGNLVFYSKGYNQPFAGIDATGSPLPGGLYTYVIAYGDSPRHTRRGTVMLIR